MSGAGCSNENNLNRLALEKSPYLLQHATNPVDWYPWGEEAFAKAQSEDKPIFLSVGYSTCHCLKALEDHAKKGLLSADKSQVAGEDCWHKCALQLSRSYEADFGGFSMAPKFPQPTNFNFLFHLYDKEKDTERGLQCLEMCLHTLKKMAYGGIHDHVNEGFARYSVDERWHVPHFEKMLYDQAQLTVSYCDAYVVTKDEFFADVAKDILSYVSKDLSHELGGFYCAQDADSYPYEGALHKMEGAFCVWEYDEIRNLLDEETNGIKHSDVVIFHYNVKEKGNVSLAQDPHKELKNKNILSCFDSYESTARKFNISIVLLKEILEKSHKVLYEERQKRPKPDTDTKILTSWNGLMISGFAKAGFVLKNQSYINRAILAANFIKKFLYSEEDKFLFRCCYKGDTGQISQTSSPIAGFLDDYAFLIRGLLDLYESSLDADWLQWAETLQETQNALFWDETNAGYFSSSSLDKSILLRSKEEDYLIDQDGVEPCGNSVSVHNLIRLSTYLHRNDLREKAGETLACFSERLKMFPIALPEMTSALMLYHNFPTQVFIAGPTEDNSTQALLDVVRSRFMPGRILAVADGPGGRAGLLYRRIETLHRLKPIEGRAAAYVCRNFTCSLPVTEPAELATSLDDASRKAAHWVRSQHPELFNHRECDPPVELFFPPITYNENSNVTESDLQSAISKNQVSDAILINNLLKAKSIDIAETTKQSLLELLCFNNSEDLLPEEFIEERWFKQSSRLREKQRKTWKDGSLADEIFISMENPSAEAYSAMIQGLAKFNHASRAHHLFEEAQAKGLVDLDTYNAIIKVAPFLKENTDLSRHYFSLLLPNVPFEEFMETTYNKLVPNVYVPEPSVMKEVIKQIELNGAIEHIPRIWSDMIVFNHNNREDLIAYILAVMVDNVVPEGSELVEKFSKIGLDIYTSIDGQAEDKYNSVKFTGDMLGKIMILLLRNSDFENASLVMHKLIHQHQKIVGVPSFDALDLFVDHCIINKTPSRAIECIQYASDSGFPDVLGLGVKLNEKLTLDEGHLNRLSKCVNIKIR
ncbi:hypothetical protein D910_11456 [Dendroctonus ponderosae]|uniref:Spermatogenesis-associated protein 20-like TRX domain-containing protein n=1 Tax=Dendroctonus ponderosae TaxID=77166 RepID=U4UJB3_DENPD|nr:hypothetical protein D910_11456 [Dendroctonus ponderosae]